ncbi:hypothetical protein [Nocardioides ochotonae]|uniref:hypothetical protein n=1 Tax=Nocardioides ochotonae TaxID=2685869 RepID=UPI00140A9AB4|nr:hypothetical protein [Nocardioides ochotonae]
METTPYRCPSTIVVGGKILQCAFEVGTSAPVWEAHRYTGSHWNEELTDDDGDALTISWEAARPAPPPQHVTGTYQITLTASPVARPGWNSTESADRLRRLMLTTLADARRTELTVTPVRDDDGEPALVVATQFAAYDDTHALRIAHALRQTAAGIGTIATTNHLWDIDHHPARIIEAP